jgi:hypothetical protein
MTLLAAGYRVLDRRGVAGHVCRGPEHMHGPGTQTADATTRASRWSAREPRQTAHRRRRRRTPAVRQADWLDPHTTSQRRLPPLAAATPDAA